MNLKPSQKTKAQIKFQPKKTAMKTSSLDLTPDQIRNNSNALALRTKTAPFIDPEKQPVIYSILEKIAEKQGKTVVQVQIDACKTDYED